MVLGKSLGGHSTWLALRNGVYLRLPRGVGSLNFRNRPSSYYWDTNPWWETRDRFGNGEAYGSEQLAPTIFLSYQRKPRNIIFQLNPRFSQRPFSTTLQSMIQWQRRTPRHRRRKTHFMARRFLLLRVLKTHSCLGSIASDFSADWKSARGQKTCL
jgi:hypothetical protein